MKKFILIILSAISIAANAEDWQFVGSSNDGVEYYKPSSVVRDGNVIKFWVLFDLNKPAKSGILSAVNYEELDCVDKKQRTLQSQNYFSSGGKGDPGKSFGAASWDYVIPGTLTEVLMNRLCR